jgi:putative endonuclease
VFAYTYVLHFADGGKYIGSTNNLKRRMLEHKDGKVPATAYRLPVELVYYEAGRSSAQARLREKALKTGYGRRYLKSRLG